VTYPAVPLTAMNMLTLPQARERLGKTEPMGGVTFAAGDTGIRVRYDKGWGDGELTDPAAAWITVPELDQAYQMTFQAARQLGSTCRVPEDLQTSWSTEVQQHALTWFLHEGLGDRKLQLFVSGAGEGPDGDEVPLVVAQTRGSVQPFSNLVLLDTVLDRIAAKFSVAAAGAAMVDYKFEHDLAHTGVRVVVPHAQQVITGTGEADDAWCLGIEFTNSCIGLKPTTVCGYVFRYICTNGARDLANRPRPFSRRGTSPPDAYAWMAEQVDEVFESLDGIFGHIQGLTDVAVVPDVATVLRDLFKQFGIPKARALAVIETMADTGGDITMYDLWNAVTVAANMAGLKRRSVDQLLAAGGHIIHAVGARCTGQLRHGCRRMLPAGWTEPDYDTGAED